MNQPLATVMLVLTVSSLATCAPLRPGDRAAASRSSAPVSDLPRPRPVPVWQTSPAAQIAWLWLQSEGQYLDLIGINGRGRQVARLNGFAATVGGPWRSADGTRILIADGASLRSFNALNGDEVQTYHDSGGQIVAEAFSPTGRYLALLLFNAGRLQLEVIDTTTGTVLGPVPVAHAPDAPMPGMQGPPSAWATAAFAPDSVSIYTLSDWGAQPHISAYSLAGGSLRQLGTAPVAVDNCGGPATTIKVVDAGAAVAAFCHYNAAVWLLDLATLGKVAVIHPVQSNPFATSPVFTPDGQILFVLEGQRIQAIDLHSQRLMGPVQISMPNRSGVFSSIASLFVTDAEAGWVASTVPIAPDGHSLYLAGSDGIRVLRIPDLTVIARLAPGVKANEIWVSGDGRTLFATTNDAHRLAVIDVDGGGTRSTNLPGNAGGFLSSEHG